MGMPLKRWKIWEVGWSDEGVSSSDVCGYLTWDCVM